MPGPPPTRPSIAPPAALPGRRGDAPAMLLGAAAAACFVSMDSVVKLLALRYEALQLGFFRFAAGSVFATLLWLWHRSPMPARAAWRLHLLRSVFLLFSLVGYFHALTQLPLALALTISYLAPIFVAVLAVPVLHERPSGRIWWALAAGLAGVATAMWADLAAGIGAVDTSRLGGMASAAASALSFAGVMLLARRQSRTDSVWTILLIQSLLPMLLIAAPAAWHWRPVATGDLPRILGAGALGTLGLVCLTKAFSRLEASRVAPLEYTGIVWAALLGYALFGELPTPATVASATLIVGGCLLLLRR